LVCGEDLIHIDHCHPGKDFRIVGFLGRASCGNPYLAII
jgi:hypothetical protein